MKLFDTGEHYGAGLGEEYQNQAYMLEFGLSRQRCTSVMLEISDEACSGEELGEGFALTGISFLLGIESDTARIGRGRHAE
jgi:hypothetical protein